jgi:hypothetical protein
LEWDDKIPSFDEVHGEALKANRFLATNSGVVPVPTVEVRELTEAIV